MPAQEWQAAESLLARLVARAYAADHPELFRPAIAKSEPTDDSGASPAARADAAAPTARGGGPEKWSMEHDDNHGRSQAK